MQIDNAQTFSHLRLIGLLIDFREKHLADGVHRIVNGYEYDE